jgi:hypothetical protein
LPLASKVTVPVALVTEAVIVSPGHPVDWGPLVARHTLEMCHVPTRLPPHGVTVVHWLEPPSVPPPLLLPLSVPPLLLPLSVPPLLEPLPPLLPLLAPSVLPPFPPSPGVLPELSLLLHAPTTSAVTMNEIWMSPVFFMAADSSRIPERVTLRLSEGPHRTPKRGRHGSAVKLATRAARCARESGLQKIPLSTTPVGPIPTKSMIWSGGTSAGALGL